MLSPKARAFSVDQLLGHSEEQKDEETKDSEHVQYQEELCPSMGDDPGCLHAKSVHVYDADGRRITVELCQSELWQAFHSLGTEMIITKTGRRMFPAVRVRFGGLKKTSRYRVSVEFIPVDNHKYRYVYHSSKWMVSGVGDSMKSGQLYRHPECPMSGEFLSTQVVSFEKIKLTNNDHPTSGQISLMSMQKFQPRIILEELVPDSPGNKGQGTNVKVTFPQTSFIAVTAYQNQEITRLKIARNPFAKGFREAGKCRSSLEAMMSTFGVVLDPNHTKLPRKRPFSTSSEETCDQDHIPPFKQNFGLWPASLSSSDRSYMPLPFINSVHNKTFASHSHDFTSDDSKERICSTSNFDETNTRDYSNHQVSISDETSRLSKYISSVNTSELHPAFRHSSIVAPDTFVNSSSLSSIYRGFLYNPVTSLLYLQSPLSWSLQNGHCVEETNTKLKSDEKRFMDKTCTT